MLKLFNPWMILAAIVALGGAFAYGTHIGYEHSQNGYIAAQAKQLSLEEKIQTAIANEVSKIKVTNTVVRGKVETITRENIVYRDCRNDAAVVGLLNDLLTGKTHVPVGDRVLPAPDAPVR